MMCLYNLDLYAATFRSFMIIATGQLFAHANMTKREALRDDTFKKRLY